jgi:hypothetical protein
MTKALNKGGIERMSLNIVKAIRNKPLANILVNVIETISSKVRKERSVSSLTTLIKYSVAILSHSNKTGKRNKRNSNGDNFITSLFADDMILYIKDPKIPPKAPQIL